MKFIKMALKTKPKYPYYQVIVYDFKNDPLSEKDFQNKDEAKKYFDLLKKKYKNKNDVELYEQKSKDSFDLLEIYDSTKDVRKNDGGYKQGYKDGKYMYKNHQPEDPDDIHEQHSAEYEQGYWDGVEDAKEEDFYKSSSEQPTTPKPTTILPDNMMYAWDPKANQWIAVMKDNPVVTPPTYNPNNVNNLNSTTTTQMYTPIKSTLIDSLNQFLDGDKYSREIKIEKGLISGGLIKLAGINPIRGPKYSITDKGLQVLKQAAQEEYNKEKKSYLLDGISEEEFKTGAPESQGQMPKFSIFEKDGSELAQIQANNEIDAKVKFIMENPEYEGSQTISVKKIDSTYNVYHDDTIYKDKSYKNNVGLYIPYFNKIDDVVIDLFQNNPMPLEHIEDALVYMYGLDIKIIRQKLKNNELSDYDIKRAVLWYEACDSAVDYNLRRQIFEDSLKEYNLPIKKIDSTYSETTIQGLDFPNQSVSPSTDIKVDPKGWVNMAGLKIEAVKLTPKLLQLGNILMPYINNNSIGVSIADENKGMISARGDAKTINIIESKIRDLGIFCNNETLPADEGKGIYTLNIFLED